MYDTIQDDNAYKSLLKEKEILIMYYVGLLSFYFLIKFRIGFRHVVV